MFRKFFSYLFKNILKCYGLALVFAFGFLYHQPACAYVSLYNVNWWKKLATFRGSVFIILINNSTIEKYIHIGPQFDR